MIFHNEHFEIEIIDESGWLNSSQGESRKYCQDYLLGEDFQYATRYGVIVKKSDGSTNSCSVLVNGGPTKVNANSAILIGCLLFLAIGNIICCFEIPSLGLKWHQKVDTATCFGIHFSPDNIGILSHGEIEIVKIGFDGKIIWSASGKDIFTEDFAIFPNHVEVIDFNHEIYNICLSNGQVSLR